MTTLEFPSSFITKLEQEIEIFPDSFQIVDLIGRSLQYRTNSIYKKKLYYNVKLLYVIYHNYTTLNLVIKLYFVTEGYIFLCSFNQKMFVFHISPPLDIFDLGPVPGYQPVF